MKLSKPLVFSFQPGEGQITLNNDIMNIPEKINWKEFKSNITNELSNPVYDYAVVSFRDMGDALDNKDTLKSLVIKTNTILKESSNQGLRVFNRFDNQLYFLNPSFDESKNGNGYAPNDETVLAIRDSFNDEYAWQHYQSKVIDKLAINMELTSGKSYESSNHLAMLTSPSRGLDKSDLDKFFSWKANQVVIPELVGSNFVGIPSIKATSFDDIQLSIGDTPIETTPINLKTVGMQGAMIPMSNPRGDTAKYQIATDISPINVVLKARASDGISIQKSEFFDKRKGRFGTYNFNLNGEPSNLTVWSAKNDSVTFVDSIGEFSVNMKQDIKPLLVERGYDIPELIDTLKPEAASKYIWMSPGTMIGSNMINNGKDPENNRISPSVAGFITAKEPSNGSDEYLVLVAEGALKGVITAKYLTAKDINGDSVADMIAKDRGLIVAQVPGVAASFVKSVDRIYDEKNVVGTYIAMDADGRDNLAVAKGIHSAFNELSNHGPVKVMSWNPDQKGIDDALIAIAKHDITVSDMDIHFGSPEKLFPLDQAVAPNPYKLDGTRANSQSWVSEYSESKKERDEKLTTIQTNSSTNVQLSLDGLDDLSTETDNVESQL